MCQLSSVYDYELNSPILPTAQIHKNTVDIRALRKNMKNYYLNNVEYQWKTPFILFSQRLYTVYVYSVLVLLYTIRIVLHVDLHTS
jgi:hypothetical protein